MSRERQKETIFLRRCIRYEDSAASRELDDRIAHAQRNEYCLHRATWLVALLAALAVACLGYEAVFQDSFPRQMFVFTTRFITNVVCALGLGSLISLLAFTVLELAYHRELNKRREEGRRFVTKLMESRVGKRHLPRHDADLREPFVIALPNGLAVPLPEHGIPPGTAAEAGDREALLNRPV